MFDRIRLGTLFLICLVVPFIGCGSSTQLDSISVSPATLTFAATGLTAQLIATGTVGHGSHPATTEDVTDLVTWTTGSKDVATVSSTGLVTSVGPGSIQVTASINGFTGVLSSSSQVTVTVTTTTSPNNTDVTSIAIIPGTQAVAAPKDTAQFIAIGTTSAGTTVSLPGGLGTLTWATGSSSVATIQPTGIVTAVGVGTTTISAVYANTDGTVATGTASFTVLSGTTEPITALNIIPNSESLSASSGQGQLIAIGTSGSTGLTANETNATTVNTNTGYITWSSSAPAIATVCDNSSPSATCNASNNGLVVGVSPGVSTITAQWNNPDGSVVVATATVSITATAAPEPLLSLQIIPASITVGNLQDTGNFLAIGTFSSVPYVRDLTNTVNWISSAPQVFPVSTDSSATNEGAPGGVVTAYGFGTATIIAEATSSDGTIQTATATFQCPLSPPSGPDTGTCYPGSQANGLLVTLTVYNEGLNTTNWEVTAPSATNQPDVLHCGPGWTLNPPPNNTGGSVCTATYPIGTTVILTASQPAGATGTFGGWSYNCVPQQAVTAAGPNTCSIVLGEGSNSNVTVGAIFN
jgi:hypothetical protein